MQPFVDWSKPFAYQRRKFSMARRTMRPQPFYHRQNYWKPYNDANKPLCGNSNRSTHGGRMISDFNDRGYDLLWELDKVDRQIQSVQSEIVVLKQQLKIMRTYSATPPTAQGTTQPNQLNYATRYCPFCPQLTLSSINSLLFIFFCRFTIFWYRRVCVWTLSTCSSNLPETHHVPVEDVSNAKNAHHDKTIDDANK